jgi:hypothetical protein
LTPIAELDERDSSTASSITPMVSLLLEKSLFGKVTIGKITIENIRFGIFLFGTNVLKVLNKESKLAGITDSYNMQ